MSVFSNIDNNDKNSNEKFIFYNSIGSPKLIVAPMVDQSELPYRMMTRKYGANLVFTQMFNANSFISSKEYRTENFTTCPEDRPLIVQFAGHDPQTILQAAKLVEDRCDAVDINLGCPQGIAKRGRYGAFLMEELDLLYDIVRTLSNNLKIPVTCKTRIYKDFDRSIRLCETLVNAGASMLTIHGRTREEKGQYVAEADWEMIRRIKEHFGNRVPIIANGGISSLDDVERCLEYTKCDGVMSSEAILENPTLFCTKCSLTPLTQIEVAEEYLSYCQKYPSAFIRQARSHLMRILHRYLHKHTDIRDRLTEGKSWDEFNDIVRYIREIAYDNDNDYQDIWYSRYRNINRVLINSSLDIKNGVYGDDEIWDCSSNTNDGSLFSGLQMFDDDDDNNQ